MRTAAQIETSINNLKHRQQFEAIEEGGAGIHYTPEFYAIEDKLDQLYEELDNLAIEPAVTPEQIRAIKGSEIIKEKFKVKNYGADHFMISGFQYGDEVEKLIGSAEEVARWINQYFGLGRGTL